MPVSGALERYLVKPGSKVDLAKIDSDERALFQDGGKDDSAKAFDNLQDELQYLQKVLYAQNKHRILLVLQAMDTGGKDGCVKHVFSRIDPQGIHVRSFKKPTEEELARDFLWRVHEKVPRNGEMVIFNRSHYEDVLVTRVEGIIDNKTAKARLKHIENFEALLTDSGTQILKFYLHVSPDEQRQRLQDRLTDPTKHWKFNPGDLEARAKWDAYTEAYEAALTTSTAAAPWYVIPADRKWYRNLCVARIVLDTMKKLKMTMPEPSWNPSEVRIGD